MHYPVVIAIRQREPCIDTPRTVVRISYVGIDGVQNDVEISTEEVKVFLCSSPANGVAAATHCIAKGNVRRP